MQLLKSVLLLTAGMAIVAAAPTRPVHAENNACYYKREAGGYVKRDPSGAEVACGIQIAEKRTVAAENLACYYKREVDSYVKRDPSGAEVACGVNNEKRTVAAENLACYYKRETGSYVKRDPSGAEVACGVHNEKRIVVAGNASSLPWKTKCFEEFNANRNAQLACYYKRETDSYVKRDPSGAEVACGVHNDKREPVIAAADNKCYYRRHEDGRTVGYKRDPNGQETLCGGSPTHIQNAE